MLATIYRNQVLCRAVSGYKANTQAYHATNEPILLHKTGSDERAKLDSALNKMQSGQPHDIPIVIGGKEFKTSKMMKQVYPFDHKKVLANFYYADDKLINSAIESVIKARKRWSRVPFEKRADVLLKAADLVSDKYRYDLLASTMLGQAKTIFQAEIDAAAELADFFRFNVQFAYKALEYQPISTKDANNKAVLRPTEGFWAAIPPFNFTAIAGNLASAPALMGNGVLWKPSDTAVLSNYIVYKLLLEAGMPEDVISFIPADGPKFGEVVTSHPELAGINFTGSTKTYRTILSVMGKKIATYKNYPRGIGECGGKNYHFVHPSADLKEAALGTIRSSFEFSGQKCSACSRLYVPKSRWSEMKPLLLSHHKELKIGSPLVKDTFSSAVIDAISFKKVTSYIDYAKSSPDCEIVAGGTYDGSQGYYVHPTIVETKDPNNKMMKDDIFGPIVTVYVYDDKDIDGALDLVDNTTDYALTGAVFAKDEEFLKKAHDRLVDTIGNFYVNVQSTGSVVGQQPFGGARLSGTNDKAGGPSYVLRFASPLSVKTQQIPIASWKQEHMK